MPGLGAGLDLLTWLDRYIFPLERDFDEAAAERLAPVAWRAFAAAGTTTALVYGAVYEASLDASFRAAEAHGIRAIIGKVMMDRGTYDPVIKPVGDPRADAARVGGPHRSMAWAGRRAAAVRGHAAVRHLVLGRAAARVGGAGRLDRRVLADPRVGGSRRDRRGRAALPRGDRLRRRLRPGRRAGRSGPCWRMPCTCPIGSWHGSSRPARTWRTARRRTCSSRPGVMPLARYRAAGLSMGLGSDVAGGPDLSIFTAMRVELLRPERVARRRAGRRPGPDAARLAPDGLARWGAGARPR